MLTFWIGQHLHPDIFLLPFEYSSNGFFIRKLKTPAHLKRCAGQNRGAYRCSTDSKQVNKIDLLVKTGAETPQKQENATL